MRRSFIIIGICFSLTVSTVAVAQSQDAGSLLALHRTYVGWHFGQYSTMRIKGHYTTASGASDGTWETAEMGAAYRTQSSLNGDSGFTGHVFWESDANGFTRPDYSVREALLISRSVLFDEGTSELHGTSQGTQTIRGTSYPVVRVQPTDGDAIDLAVDPATGAYVRAVIDPGGPYETQYDILGYTQFDGGKRYIGRYQVAGSDDIAEVTSVESNVPVSTTELHPPSPTATWTFGSTAPVPLIQTPFAFLVNATVNGVPGLFVVDTGSSDIILSTDFAAKAHLTQIGSAEVMGAVGSVRGEIDRADSVSIGGNTLQHVIVTVVGRDVTQNAENYHENLGTLTINGYLGYPLFGAAIVTINTSNKTLSIADPALTTVDKSGGYPALVDLWNDVPMLPMVIDKRATVLATLDSGNGSFVAVSQDAVTKYHLPILASQGTESTVGQQYSGVNSNFDPDAGVSVQNYFQSHQMIEGIGGRETLEVCSTVSSIALGPIVDQSTYACVSPYMTGDNILMGFAYLTNFDMVFDYPEGILLLKPHAH
jgi:predicted aspartyl protease